MTREEAIEQFQNCIELIKQDGKDWLDDRDIPMLNMAIEALQAKTDGDTISRKAVLRLFPNGFYSGLASQIKSLPSVEPKTGWIPCSERMPSEDGNYLVCMSWNNHIMDVLMWADGWNCIRYTNGKVNRKSEIDRRNIIAWMPLPEPYKGGEEE